MLKVGDKAIYRPNWKNHIHDRKTITIIGHDTLNRYIFSIDDFPNCNHREYHNRFWCLHSEVETIK